MLYTAIILLFSLSGGARALPDTAGVQITVIETLGSHSDSKYACMRYAEARRNALAVEKGLSDPTQLGYDCGPAP